MRFRATFIAVAICILFTACQPRLAGAEDPIVVDQAAGQRLNLTVYSGNFGVVRDSREIDLVKGEGWIEFLDVASSIDPVTVQVRSLKTPESFRILEQNYQYDLIHPQALLSRYVGEKIKLVNWNEYQDRKTEVEATLLSINGPTYQIGEEIYIGHPGTQVLPELPGNLTSKPTLLWNYASNQAGRQTIETTYVTSQLDWKTDYTLALEPEGTRGSLTAWVTLTNQSGASYANADLRLVAGDVNRSHQNVPQPRMMMKASMAMDEAVSMPSFGSAQMGDYQIFDYARKVTLHDQETKQLNFFSADKVSLLKELRAYGNQGYYNQAYDGGETKLPVQIYYKLKNSAKDGLGTPLPGGVIRVYQRDKDARSEFVGEGNVRHLPVDEDFEIQIGKAFHVTVERKQTDYQRVSKQMHESAWQVLFRNATERDVTVKLIETVNGNWKILEHSQAFVKESAHQVVFEVVVPAKGEAEVTYRVQIGI